MQTTFNRETLPASDLLDLEQKRVSEINRITHYSENHYGAKSLDKPPRRSKVFIDDSEEGPEMQPM